MGANWEGVGEADLAILHDGVGFGASRDGRCCCYSHLLQHHDLSGPRLLGLSHKLSVHKLLCTGCCSPGSRLSPCSHANFPNKRDPDPCIS